MINWLTTLLYTRKRNKNFFSFPISDVLPGITIFLVIFFIAFSFSSIHNDSFDVIKTNNVWFQADIGNVYENMTDRLSDHYQTKVHPLFSLAVNPPIYILHKLGLAYKDAVQIFIAILSGIWGVCLFVLLRILGHQKLDSILFTSLALASSSSFFWLTMPETFLLGSISILIVLIFAVLTARRTYSSSWYIIFSSLSLSITVTNWMTGIFTTLANNPWKKSVQILLNSVILVAILWKLQNILYPSSQFFLSTYSEELKNILINSSGSLLEKLTAFFLHSMVMPDINILEAPQTRDWPILSIQFSEIGSSGLIGSLSSILWIILLIMGLWILIKKPHIRKFKTIFLATLIGQLCLHLIYGDETFRYSLHWLPLLIIVASYSTLSQYRLYILILSGILLILISLNNYKMFEFASNALNNFKYEETKTEREKVRDAMLAYPNADWPRGDGHVLIAPPQTPLLAKGYHEPGGSFSPGFGSFGLSIAQFKKNGELYVSSNSIPIQDISQRILSPSTIKTITPYYSTEWSSISENHWQLKYTPNNNSEIRSGIRISSTGPSGGALSKLEWTENELIINNIFSITLDKAPQKVVFLKENVSNISQAKSMPLKPYNGFGASVILLREQTSYQIDVRKVLHSPVTKKKPDKTRKLSIKIKDEHFSDSLQAQLFHLRAGIVANETRPGEPGNYDLNWLRDGAFIIVALARMGELELAKDLLIPFTEQDFFGGFGSEADSPGLAIWAIFEVLTRLDDHELDQQLWPHIQRKANIILELIESKKVLHKAFSGPIVSSLYSKSYGYLSQISKPSKQGLIIGKMDNHYPVLYVNAIAYMGLKNASKMAYKLGYKKTAARFTSYATQLQQKWNTALREKHFKENNRTFISGIWPSNIASTSIDIYEQQLHERWKTKRTTSGDFIRTPMWTYFDVSEAHQWLLLGNNNKAWSTLEWFWNNQVSPGLYTWWESDGEENSSGLWQGTRGWINPRHVTPHYWTAAEIALLQLDMLAYEHTLQGKNIIQIGTGMTKNLLKDNIVIKNLSMRKGYLDWEWDGVNITITWHGSKEVPKFTAGKAFPESAKIIISKN